MRRRTPARPALSSSRRRSLGRLLTGGVAAGAASALALGPAAADTPPEDLERAESVTGRVSPAEPAAPAPQVRRGAAVSAADLAARLDAAAGPLTPGFGGIVTDTRTGRTVWQHQSTWRRAPASTMKVVTATTALRTFGSRHRFVTPVSRAGTNGDYVYLRGVGDPTMSSWRLDSMARSAAWRLKKAGTTSVRLRVDDTLFPAPTNAPGWEPGDVGRYVTPVRALVRDQSDVSDTSMDAGSYFRSRLEHWGVDVTQLKRAKTHWQAETIAEGTSPQLRDIVGDMLRVSQNDYAESLLWAAGMRAGALRTWSGVTEHSTAMVGGYGVPTDGLTFSDGSGLSRSNRLSARALSVLLLALYEHPSLSQVIFADDAMPISGRTGTLSNRFGSWPATCAVGRVRAKTGSLRDATALAGVAEGTDGVERVFVALSHGPDNTATVRHRIDVLAATATTCT